MQQAAGTAVAHAPPTQQAEVGGLSLTYREAGAGPAVLYLHGKDFAARWLPFHVELTTTLRVLAPQHPGFGATPAPSWFRGFDDGVIVHRELLDHLGLDRVHVVGLDIGAWMAADLAVFHPERVASLTVVAPFGLRVPGSPIADFFGASGPRNAELLFGADPGPFAELLPAPGDIDAFVASYADASGAARLMWNPRYDLKLDHRLPRLHVPALVVAAGEDRLVPAAHAARLAELLPDARLETIDGAAHAVHLQQPERLAALIQTFISEVHP